MVVARINKWLVMNIFHVRGENVTSPARVGVSKNRPGTYGVVCLEKSGTFAGALVAK